MTATVLAFVLGGLWYGPVFGNAWMAALGKTEELEAGQLLYLAAEEPHSVKCVEDASFLLTIMLNR